jgi:hypothetical protein
MPPVIEIAYDSTSETDEESAQDVVAVRDAANSGIASALNTCAAAALSALRNSCSADAILHQRTALARSAIITGSIAAFVISAELLYETATQPGAFSTGQTVGVAICSLLMPVSAAAAFSSAAIARACCPNAQSRNLHPLPV